MCCLCAATEMYGPKYQSTGADYFSSTINPPSYFNSQTHTLTPAFSRASANAKEAWVQSHNKQWSGTKPAFDTGTSQSWKSLGIQPVAVKTDRQIFGWPDPNNA